MLVLDSTGKLCRTRPRSKDIKDCKDCKDIKDEEALDP